MSQRGGALSLRFLLDDDALSSCVSCGLCLPHCPTYRVTGFESASPRGRIAAMRVAKANDAPLDGPDPEFVRFMDECIQCRACEAVCPSSVPFGHLMEGVRQTLASSGTSVPWGQRRLYGLLGHHRLLLTGSTAVAVAQRAGMVPARFGVPKLPLRRRRLRPVAGTPGADEVWLFTGCVMDAWMRPIHAAALRVLEAAGASVRLPGRGAACCGALQVHAGLNGAAARLAQRVMRSMPGEGPVLVDSAGCGATLKDYGHLLGTAEAAEFSHRVYDVHEWLAGHVDRLPAAVERWPVPVAVQDPCHLRHVQRAHEHVRTVLAPYADLIELDDDGLCCGAGGAYSVLQPELAAAVRDRKLEAISRSGVSVVASANPGCAMHLAAAGIEVRHPVEIIDAAIKPDP
ncbi:MAG TPA: (Fe-S)-binding protein [Acidimicrobiales bacterium]|nr:(Fe-S)-binding protein [Acidimicrobiales bacterium]